MTSDNSSICRARHHRAVVPCIGGGRVRNPTPIQTQAIPHLLIGKDLLGIAQTGTGKTAAFALPILQRLQAVRRGSDTVPALMLAPTRELADQIARSFARYGEHRPAPCVRSSAASVRTRRSRAASWRRCLDRHAGTAARSGGASARAIWTSIDARARRSRSHARHGLHPRRAARSCRAAEARQTLLFSATMPTEIARSRKNILLDPVAHRRGAADDDRRDIDQHGRTSSRTATNAQLLTQLLRDPPVTRAIVFTRTKHGANRVAEQLDRAGISAEAIHGNKSQNARAARARTVSSAAKPAVLVATDIAARGIDIDARQHVVNFDLPHVPESYVHRIGRTGRAGASGTATSLCDASERPRLRAIERADPSADQRDAGADRRKRTRCGAGSCGAAAYATGTHVAVTRTGNPGAVAPPSGIVGAAPPPLESGSQRSAFLRVIHRRHAAFRR